MHMAVEGPGWSGLPFSASLIVLAGSCALFLSLSWLYSVACFLFFPLIFYFMPLYASSFFYFFYTSYFSTFQSSDLFPFFSAVWSPFSIHPTENCVIWGRGTPWSMISSVIWLTRVTITGEGSTEISFQKCDPTWYGNCARRVMFDLRQEKVGLS